MRTRAALLGLLGLATAGACGEDADAGFSHYFSAQPYDNPACNTPDGRLAGRREARLYSYGGVDVPPLSRGLQRYYRRYGLTFFGMHEVQSIAQPYALDTDMSALTLALAQAFPGVDATDDAALMRDPALYASLQRFVMNFIFRPVIEFARSYGTVGTGVTNLVVTPRILRTSSGSLLGSGEEVAGLGVSPALIAVFASEGNRASADAPWSDIDLPPDFTPMIFLDGKVMGSLLATTPILADLVIAHEFGHTAGLTHRDKPHNLMLPAVMPGVSDCTDLLEDDQIETMRATLGFGAKTAARRIARGDSPDTASPPGFAPPRLRALLAGDPEAFRAYVRPFAFLLTFPAPGPQARQTAPTGSRAGRPGRGGRSGSLESPAARSAAR